MINSMYHSYRHFTFTFMTSNIVTIILIILIDITTIVKKLTQWNFIQGIRIQCITSKSLFNVGIFDLV